jgi:hypothetical protein
VKPQAARRAIHPGSYVLMALLSAAIVIPAHLWLARLPYFWDEAGQFIPAALDLLHDGAWIPHSTVPNIHPPAIPAYLAGVWRIAGFSPVSTRMAMLALASLGVLAAFLLAIELTRDAKGAPAFLAAALLCVSPLFFAQSMLAQLDAPAMLFTTLALLLFVQDHIRAAAAACVALVLVKETGTIVPLIFGVWLARERRWRDAAWFAVPVATVAAWIVILARNTGSWTGNPDFAQYNVRDPLHPVRLMITLARRVFYLGFSNFHWVGTLAALYAWRRSSLFRSRPWRIAGAVVAAHVLAFTVLGGAVLNRYLLPTLPILFAAMAAALSVVPRIPRIVATCVLLGGLAASNFINPPYPFPFEENLAFADFLKLHTDAADYIAHWYDDPVVHTTWPLSAELSIPELGFVGRKIRVAALPNLSNATLDGLDWSKVQILVVFSRNWDPHLNLIRLAPMLNLWEHVYDYVPNATAEARARVPFPIDASFTRHGQWVEIYVNPDLPRIPHAAPYVAAALIDLAGARGVGRLLYDTPAKIFEQHDRLLVLSGRGGAAAGLLERTDPRRQLGAGITPGARGFQNAGAEELRDKLHLVGGKTVDETARLRAAWPLGTGDESGNQVLTLGNHSDIGICAVLLRKRVRRARGRASESRAGGVG